MRWAKPLILGIILGTFFCTALPAKREEGDTLLEKKSLNEVVIRGARGQNRIASALPTQSVSGEQLTKLGLQSVADAVRRMAGTQVKDYGGIGGMKTVSVHNMGASHTAVAYDGVAVSNCQAGQIDIGRFSLNRLDRITLSLGQEDNLLQPARLQASGAVLSLSSAEPFRGGDADRRYGVNAQLRGGSFGMGEALLQMDGKVGKHTVLSVLGEYMRADGIYPFTLTNGTVKTEEERKNSDICSVRGEVDLKHRLAGGGLLKMKAYYYRSKRGLPGSVILYNPTSNERLWDENFFVQAQYREDFSEKWQFLAQAKYNHSWNRYEDTGVKYVSTGGKLTDIHREDEGYLQGTLLYRPASHWTLSLAQDLVLNCLRNNLSEMPCPTRYTSLTALNLRYRCDLFTVTGTLLNTCITETVDRGDAPADRKRLSPALSMICRPVETLPLYLRGMLKSTYRVPSFNDLYYRRMGNTRLRPERAQEYNIGITWSGTPEWSFMELLTLTADGYYHRVTDKLVAFPTTYIWKMANFGKVDVWGADFTLQIGLHLTERTDAQLTAHFTWQRAVDDTDASSKYYHEQLPYTPAVNGGGTLSVNLPWLSVGYSLLAMGERYSMSQHLPIYRMAGFAEHTLTLSKEWKLRRDHIRFTGEVVNFTDTMYSIIQYYPMPGRSYRATLSIRL